MHKLDLTYTQPRPVWRGWRHGGWIVCLVMAFCWSGLAQPVAAQTPPTCAAGTVGPLLSTGTPSPRPALVAGAKFVKPTANGTGNGTNWDNALGAASLKAAIEAGGTVYIAAGTYTVASYSYITLAQNVPGHFIYGGFPANATGTNLAGYDPNANQTIISGAGGAMWLFYNSGRVDNITLQGLVLQDARGSSGSVFYSGQGDTAAINFKFIDLLVRNNSNSAYGAFYLATKSNEASRLLFLNSTFSGNRGSAGGAITVNSSGSSVTNNNRFLIDGVSFVNNISSSDGGAVGIAHSSPWTIRNSSFCGNQANSEGGAFYLSSTAQNKIENTAFRNNTALRNGGALLATSAMVTIDNSFFVGNQSSNQNAGGAIYGMNAAFAVTRGYFYNNRAGAGGAIYYTGAYNNLQSKADNSFFVGNQVIFYPYGSFSATSGVGGAVALANSATGWDFTNTRFVNNSVPGGGWGGAIANAYADVKLSNTLFYGNTIGGNATMGGSDIRHHQSPGGSFSLIRDTKLQLANSATYKNQAEWTTAAYGFSTGNTFNNSDNGAVPPAPTNTCPTALPAKLGVGAPVRNTCVAATLNLDNLHTGTTPTNALLLWSSDGDPSNGLSSISAAVTANSGVYFAYYYDGANQCYSPASTAVTVESVVCDGATNPDGDGLSNELDVDDDNDGLLDTAEGSGDSDGDGMLDRVDLDSDNDGLNDVREANGTDANGDGLADGVVNGSGLPGTVPAGGLTPPDSDGDGKSDLRDLDSDNDVINDLIERGNRILDDTDGLVDGVDSDGDGIKDGADGRAGFGDGGDPVPANLDNDAIPNYRDLDSNDDTLYDLRDSDASLGVDNNNDGKVDDITDPDNDGILTIVDGAPLVYGDRNNPTTANLAVTKSVEVTTITPGVPFSYQITVRNNGPHSAPNVVLTEVLPTDAIVNAMTPSLGGSCTQSATTIRCTWLTLAASASATVTINVTP